jgi:Ca2+-binding RTX toxin-like protein
VRALILVPALALVGALTPLSAAAAATTCEGRLATIVGDNGRNVINGTAGNDVINAGGGNDVVNGRGGNDRICGGSGADNLHGGPGGDRLFGGADHVFVNVSGSVERVGDQLRGDTGRDRLVPGVDARTAEDISPDVISWDSSPRGVRLDLAAGATTGIDPDTFVPTGAAIEGSPYADVVVGSSSDDQVFSGAGADEVRTGDGNDYVLAGPGADLVDGGTGHDQIHGDEGRDRLFGGRGDDTVEDFGRDGDRLYGLAGDDLLSDQLFEDGQPKALYGGAGQDTLSVFSPDSGPGGAAGAGLWDMRLGRLTVSSDATPVTSETGGFERNELNSNGIAWKIQGTDGADVLETVTPGTEFDGRGGDDTFGGWFFADVFRGGPGTDRGIMRDGTDTCVSVEVLERADCENVSP